MIYIFAAILLLAGTDRNDWYHPKWAVIAALGATMVVKKVWAIDRLAAIVLAYTVGNGIFFSLTAYGYTHDIDVTTQMMLGLSGNNAILVTLALAMVAVKFELKRKALSLAYVASTLWLIVACLAGWLYKGPDLNSSLSATLVALMAPLMLGPLNELGWIYFAFPALAIGLAGSRISALALVVGLLAYLWRAYKFNWWSKVFPVGIAVCVAFLVWMTVSNRIQFSGRKEMWSAVINTAHDGPVRALTGYGLGSYLVYGPEIQKFSAHQFRDGGAPITMHNDYLQAWFELGWIGLALWLALYAKCIWVSRNTPWAFAFFASLAILSFGNFPHHLGMDALVIAVMIGHALKGHRNCQSIL